jgi:hypothetical protein
MQHRLQSIGRAVKAQGLSRALIEPQRYPVQVGLRETREICSPREILPQQAVGVLVAAALPRTAWITEVDLHVSMVKVLCSAISLPRSQVKERRSS